MMNMQMSAAGRAKLTEPWEECVLYPYDDKVAKRRGQYPEWIGGTPRGTPTVGWGHTDAAGGLKIVPGMRLTQQEADALLTHDLEPCMARVNRALKVPVSQHVFDGMVDMDFNCPSATAHIAAFVNAGNIPGAQRVMLQYINSKGERMPGLVNRRNAEIKWMNTPDDPEEAAAVEVFSPKAEREPAPSRMRSSTIGAASVATTAGGGALATLQAANQAAAPIEEAKQHLINLGLLDQLVLLVHTPAVGVALGVGIVVLGVFVFFERRHHLLADHV